MTIEMEISKLLEEVKELKQAVGNGNIDCIVEELADVYVALGNSKEVLQNEYKFSNAELSTMQEYKKARTARRFKEGYYGK